MILLVAAWTDFRKGMIPNQLLLLGTIIGVLTTDHFFRSISYSILFFLIFFPLFQIGTIGAGDIKCFIMMSFYLNGTQFLEALFYSFLLAAGTAVCKNLYTRSFFRKKNKIHLAFSIFLGTLISVGGTYL